jgi:hypothetical protein
VPHAQHPIKINLQEATTRNRTARDFLTELSSATPHLSGLWLIFDQALADAPALIAETARLRSDLADLLAAARATLTADHDEEPDPLYYLRDELTAHGQLPPDIGDQA